MADTTYEQPVTPQQQGKTPPETDEPKPEGDRAAPSSPWNPSALLSAGGELFSRATKAVPNQFPNVEVGEGEVPVQQGRPVELTQTRPVESTHQTGPANSMDFRPRNGIADNPLVEKTIQKIKDSPDPVLEVVNMVAGGLDNLRGAKVYQTVYGDYQLQMSTNHRTRDKMVDKSMGPFSSGPVTMDTEFGMRASLTPGGGGSAMLQLNNFYGVHPTVEGPLKNRGVLPGGATLFKGNDGDYHMSVNGQAVWGRRGNHLTKSRNITIDPSDVRDPFLRGMMQDATDIDRTLSDLLKVQQSQDVLSIGLQRAPSTVAGTEQFDMHVRSRREKHMPVDQEVSAGLPVKVKSVDLGTDVSASLSYSREAGVGLSNINGVKINVESFGLKQVVSPTKLTFSRDAAGKAAVGVQFVMHDAQGKAGEPMNFSIPFSKIIQELGETEEVAI